MTNKYTGGFAFPQHTMEPNPNGGEPRIIWQEGMTLRDYFAAKALPLAYQFWMNDFYHPDQPDAVERNADGREDFMDNYQLIADDCYAMADAMMKARDE